jgi:hypothetical protein
VTGSLKKAASQVLTKKNVEPIEATDRKSILTKLRQKAEQLRAKEFFEEATRHPSVFASFNWLTTNLLRVRSLRLLKDPRHKGLWLDLLCIVSLALAATRVLWGVDEVIDITLSDEILYLHGGVTLLERGFPRPQWAPLYSVWYFLLSFFTPNNLWLYYFNSITLTSLTPVLLYIALRRLEVSLIISFLISGLYLLSFSNLGVAP